MKESQRKGLISVHVAVALFGFVGLFAKLVDLPAVIIVLGRVFFFIYFSSGFFCVLKSRKFAWRRKVIICGWSEQVQF